MSDHYVLPPHGSVILPGIAEISALRESLKQYPDEVLWEYLEKTGASTYANAEVLRLLVNQAIKAKYAARRAARRASK